MRRHQLRLLVVVALWSAPAAADRPLGGWRWAFDLDMAASYTTDAGRTEGTDSLHQGAGRIDGRGLLGKGAVGFAAAFDLEMGFTVPAGFLWGLRFLPVGGGLRFGRRGVLGVAGGAGVSQIVDRVPIAFEAPVVAFLDLDLGSHLRVLATGRASFIPWTEARQGGSPSLDFVDELDAGLGLAIGKREHEYGTWWSDGTYVGAEVREQGGVRFFGLVLAINMNGASSSDW